MTKTNHNNIQNPKESATECFHFVTAGAIC